MNQTPTEDRVVVKLVELENTTSAGIFIPTIHEDRTTQALVVAVGPGKRNKKTKTVNPMSVAVNDRVLINDNAGLKVLFNTEEVLVLKESDIIAVLDPVS